MMRLRTLLLACSLACAGIHAQQLADYPLKPVPWTNIEIRDSFWQPRLDTNRTATVPHILDECQRTGRIDNFLKAAGQMRGNFQGWWFNDSDVYKSIEAASYSLLLKRNPALESLIDSIITKIAAAQEENGYLYTPRTTVAPDYRYASYMGPDRWSRLEMSHELYDLGHLYEAAVAYHRATGKRSLLNVAIKSANLLLSLFGPNGKHDPPGHEEIEIGLTKLYRATGNADYARLAKFFLDQRGHPEGHKLYGEYSQDHEPLVDQDKAVGHAVRALYLYSGMAEAVALYRDDGYRKALDHLWNDVVGKKIYITGGIGAAGGHEGFADAFELPNLVAYCETCASVANVLWNQRMFELYGESKYIDVLERTLYNSLLAGVSEDGRSFFYSNPLQSEGNDARSPWFAVACCPPNIARILPQVAGMEYATGANEIYVNLFMAGNATIPLQGGAVTIDQRTRYPWDGKVELTIDPGQESREFALRVRIPGWARNEAIPDGLYRFEQTSDARTTMSVNGEPVMFNPTAGYAVMKRQWKKGDKVEIDFPMPVRRVSARTEVKDDAGKVALQRGPLVYCVEWPDVKGGTVTNLVLDKGITLAARQESGLLGGITSIVGMAKGLYCEEGIVAVRPLEFKAIPYYAWARRGKGEMTVWLAEDGAVAEPVPCATIASMAVPSASGGDARALNDQKEPKSSNDQSHRYLHWWPRKGTTEWVQYDFARAERVSSVEVYWYDDTGTGECRVPASWQLYFKQEKGWKLVQHPRGYGVKKDMYNKTTFDPVLTKGLKIVVQLPDGFSAGIHEWRVQ